MALSDGDPNVKRIRDQQNQQIFTAPDGTTYLGADDLVNSQGYDPGLLTSIGETLSSLSEGGDWRNARPGETEQEYLTRLERVSPQYAQAIRQAMRSNPGAWEAYKKSVGMAVDPAQQAAMDKQRADEARQAQIRDQLDHFVKWANQPLDALMKDPDTQRLIQSAQATTQNADRLNGIQGGLSDANSEKSFMDAGLAIQNQRKQMAAQAMGMQLNDVNQVNQLREQARQFDVNGYNNSLQQQYGQKQDLFRTVGAVGGGLIGAGIGGAVGGPMGAAAGASVGSSMGGGLAGNFAGPAPTYKPYVPPSAAGGGGLSGRGY